MTSSRTELGSLLVSRPGYRNGWPCLRGTGIPVHNVAAAHLRGLTVEQLCEENPDLDPSLFYAALAYYFANRRQIDEEIEADFVEAEGLAASYPEGITRDNFQARG